MNVQIMCKLWKIVDLLLCKLEKRYYIMALLNTEKSLAKYRMKAGIHTTAFVL